MKTYLRSVLAIIMIAFCACEKDPTFRVLSINDNATKVSNITATSADVTTSIFETESGDYYNYNHKTLEVYYSTSSNPFIGSYKVERCTTTVYAGTHTIRLYKLEPGTTYYYAPKLGNQTGKVRNFTTLLELTATTGGYSNLTAKSVQLEGSSIINKDGRLKNLGILVRLHNSDVTIDNYDHKEYSYLNKSYSSSSSNSYSVTKSFSGLYSESTYYYRTYAESENGKIYYGEVKSFKTTVAPTINVFTDYADNITSTSVRLHGNCTLLNGAQLAEAGVLLKRNDSNVSWTNYDTYGSGTYANFQADFTNLSSNSTYYYRAYAKDKEGNVYYGEVKSFKTLTASISVTTGATENITYTSVRVRGYCTLNNGAQLAEAGILLKLQNSNVSLTNYDLYWYGTYTNFYVDFTNLSSNSTYYYRAYAKDKEGNVYYGEVKSFKTPSQPVRNAKTAVDLGLSVKWSAGNVGATYESDYGDYFAWGETNPKSDYSWSTYFDTKDGGSTFTKYNNNGGKTTLDLSDDAAHVKWGGSWRMPTRAEQDELLTKCTWTWTSDYNGTGVKGYIASSKTNGNSIFLPASGYLYNSSLYYDRVTGYYWSSSLDSSLSDYASRLYFVSGYVDGMDRNRYYGHSVRPVCQ